jgi:hypothetical protein
MVAERTWRAIARLACSDLPNCCQIVPSFAVEWGVAEGSIAAPHGSCPNERGERLIWLDHAMVSRLRAMRGRGEKLQ